ncbi:phosphoglycerate mutase-like protein [Metschnikowia bicuspidata var. bicuspidata NRRL YB-4993]|uniref:Phosphoglycerate mutase-like protein n=1 Tax=Metschnikowia bicuspidata var. bicuspidata NRRL YB-4993 TaxID=869754 RepID=A0A1A0HAC6_9ASCO|nr:phosphoglycerate mutase-like protein [Metschnikowia bicuspidata var. bicuspidata NRRL YB-4993]OBA20966.1 phosphoglycerate mutase-like protein [Metschnikowia bicuspidata var. bicuspidata NRRL YB-4993]
MSTKPDAIDVHNSSINSEDREQYACAQSLETGPRWKFEIVPGCFKQLLPETDETTFDYFKEGFGKLKPWPQLASELRELNQNSPQHVAYKLLLLGRHGQGFHNLANLIYGDEQWNAKWLHLTTDGKIVWGPDPELTDLGHSQAKDNHKQLQAEIQQGLHLPTRWFSSPFRRSLDTLIGTWEGHVDLQKAQPFIMEDLRETLGVHTCDKRSPRRVIVERYLDRGFIIEDGFAEEDELFKDDYREKVWEQAIRQERAFQHIFSTTDKHTDDFISVTSHSGSIRTQLLVLGHRAFAIGTGGMIPVVVKATYE